MRACSLCHTLKPLTEFPRRSSSPLRYMPHCKVCQAAKSRAWYAANKSRRSASSAAYDRAHPEHRIAAQRRYRRRQRTYYTELGARRRQAIRKRMPWADAKKIAAIYLVAHQLRASGHACHVDHIVPLRSKAVCGLHVQANLQIMMADRNARKGNREWPDMP